MHGTNGEKPYLLWLLLTMIAIIPRLAGGIVDCPGPNDNNSISAY
jgi:hypothetical protein